MPHLDLLTGIKKCANRMCTETNPAAFGKWKQSKDGLQGRCKKCTNERCALYVARDPINKSRMAAYYREHMESIKARALAWGKANPEYMNAKKRRLRKTSEKVKSSDRAYQMAYRERAIDNNRRWYANPENRKKKRATDDAWIAANPEKKADQGARRRAAKNGLPATRAYGAWPDCKKYFAGCCAYCGQGGTRLEKDHFIPISARLLPDGTERPGHVPWNIVPSCTPCNRGKLHREPFTWLRKTGKLDCLPKILAYLDTMRKRHEQLAA